jgi:hypothetical protein
MNGMPHKGLKLCPSGKAFNRALAAGGGLSTPVPLEVLVATVAIGRGLGVLALAPGHFLPLFQNDDYGTKVLIILVCTIANRLLGRLAATAPCVFSRLFISDEGSLVYYLGFWIHPLIS